MTQNGLIEHLFVLVDKLGNIEEEKLQKSSDMLNIVDMRSVLQGSGVIEIQ